MRSCVLFTATSLNIFLNDATVLTLKLEFRTTRNAPSIRSPAHTHDKVVPIAFATHDETFPTDSVRDRLTRTTRTTCRYIGCIARDCPAIREANAQTEGVHMQSVHLSLPLACRIITKYSHKPCRNSRGKRTHNDRRHKNRTNQNLELLTHMESGRASAMAHGKVYHY